MASQRTRVNQCQKPTGFLGRFILWNMNARHSKVTDWGLSHVSIKTQDAILDVGSWRRQNGKQAGRSCESGKGLRPGLFQGERRHGQQNKSTMDKYGAC